MEGIEYLYELCELLPRCGPGANEFTKRAFKAIPNPPDKPLILDIGCGPGVQTLELARISNGKIIALDNHQPFLDKLMEQVKKEELEKNISIKNISMLEMDFKDSTFDIIWSEGALYFMGFQNGLKRCHQLLKSKGYLAFTELVYISPDRPEPVKKFFGDVYPDIKDVKDNCDTIRKEGFDILTNFTLPDMAWLKDYYAPIEKELPRLNKKYVGNDIAKSVFNGFRNEIDLFNKYSQYYGYEFFIAQKNSQYKFDNTL